MIDFFSVPLSDGLPDLVVYALALKTDGTNGSPGTLAGNVLTFAKRPDAVTNDDVTYAIETSADLGVNDVWHTTTTGVTDAVGPPRHHLLHPARRPRQTLRPPRRDAEVRRWLIVRGYWLKVIGKAHHPLNQ